MKERVCETRWPIGGSVARCRHLVTRRVFEKAKNGRGDDLKNIAGRGSMSKHRKRLSATHATLFGP